MSITVYTKPACPQCDHTKRVLKNADLEFTAIDVSEDEAAATYLREQGYRQVPVVVTKDQVWTGFRPDLIGKLKSLLTPALVPA